MNCSPAGPLRGTRPTRRFAEPALRTPLRGTRPTYAASRNPPYVRRFAAPALLGDWRARGLRVPVHVQAVVANRQSLVVDEAQRLVEQPRLRTALRHRRLEDVETIVVHVDRVVGPRAVGVADVHPPAADVIDDAPGKVGDFAAALDDVPGGEIDRSSFVQD